MPFQVHIIIQDSFIVSVVYDITTPLTFTLILLALLKVIHLPLPSLLVHTFGKHQRNPREKQGMGNGNGSNIVGQKLKVLNQPIKLLLVICWFENPEQYASFKLR